MDDEKGRKVISGVTYNSRKKLDSNVLVVSPGPWSCAADDWFDDLQLASVLVWKFI